jgi:stage II sporulation protein R
MGIAAGAFILARKGDMREDCIRIHIRANSNSEFDQAVKLEVRDAVVAYLTPVLSKAGNKREAFALLKGEMGNIAQIGNGVLRDKGTEYGAECAIKREEFPLRSYDGIVFQSGEYDALIISLGKGEGNNWWCVAYPPLCFIPEGEGEIEYKSKIVEIIKEYMEKHGL